MRNTRLVAGGVILAMAILLGSTGAQAQPMAGNVEFGTNTGIVGKTVDGTVFTLGIHADYFFSPNVSFGPMGMLNSGNLLIQSAIAGVGRYHYRTKHVNFVPFAGIGFMHADLRNENASGVYIPGGMTVEFPVRDAVITATGMVNIHDLTFESTLAEDPKSFAAMLGVRFTP